jgi:hypothetical protein
MVGLDSCAATCNSSERLRRTFFQPETEVQNLYLTKTTKDNLFFNVLRSKKLGGSNLLGTILGQLKTYVNEVRRLGMDKGTLKTPIPKCRLYWSFLFGVMNQFCRFSIWSETECKTPAEYGLQHNSTPPTATHCLYLLYI